MEIGTETEEVVKSPYIEDGVELDFKIDKRKIAKRKENHKII